MKLLFLTLSLFCLLFLNSCRIEGDEVVTLNADGSGTVKAYYRLPEKVFTRDQSQKVCDGLKALCQETPGLQALEHTHTDAGGEVFGPKFQRLQLQLAFDNKDVFKGIELSAAPEDQTTLETIQTIIGDIDLSISGLSANLQRSVNLKPLLKDVSPSLLGDSFFRYTIHFPTEASETNAHTTSNDHKSLHWHFLLREYNDQPMKIEANAPLPIPVWIWVSLPVLAALALFGLYWRYNDKSATDK